MDNGAKKSEEEDDDSVKQDSRLEHPCDISSEIIFEPLQSPGFVQSELGKIRDSHKSSEKQIDSASNCQLCSESLHPINIQNEDLIEENEKLRKTITSMESQGVEIVRKSQFLCRENKSLKQLNESLGDLLKKSSTNMEIMMQERLNMRKDWEEIIDKKEQEISRLRLKV